MRDFEGRVAVVTGAASGIGRALALEAAARGMHVALGDVAEAELDATRRMLLERGARCVARVCDVSNEADVVALAELVERELGDCQLLFNNAGVLVGGRVWERTVEDWRWVLGVNLFGVIHGVRVFVPRMLAAGKPAHVVNTASVGGLLAGPFLSPYVVSKHAVVALSESLRDELAAESVPIGVSVLCPGALRTGIWRSERVRPTQLAHTRPASRPDERGFLEGMGAHIDASAEPAEIAPQVFAAVRDQRFWILPDRSFEPAIRQRMQGILDALN